MLSPLLGEKGNITQNSNSNLGITIQKRKVYFYLITFILICVCGLRSVKIGLDTPQYYFLFHDIATTGNLFEIISQTKDDPIHPEWGYVLYEWILSYLCFGNYYCFLFFTAILTITPVMWLIYTYSKMPWLSITLFILFGYFTFYMSGLRQALAMTFCIIAFHYSAQNKIIRYLFYIAIAFLFHRTALIFLPIYWIKRIPLNKLVIISTIVLIGLSFYLRYIFYDLFMLISRIDYSDHEDAGGTRMFISMLFFVLLGFSFSNKLKNDNLNKSLLYMMIICIILWPILSTGSPAVYRLYYYYHIFIILYGSNLVFLVKNIYVRNTFIAIFIFIGIAYFATQIIMKQGNVYPYKFLWEVSVNFDSLQHSWE